MRNGFIPALLMAAMLPSVASAEVPVIEISPNGSSQPSFGQPLQSAPRPGSSNTQLLMLVEQMQSELRALRGQVEQQNYLIEKMKREQRDRYRDLDRRVSMLMQGEVSPAAVTEQPEVAASPATEGEATVPETPVAIAPTESAAKPADPVAEKQAYQSAFALVRQRSFEKATAAFKQFLTDYPESGRAANAHYWLGEISLAQKSYESAREAFALVFNSYPDHRKASDAAYKLGVVYDALGDAKNSAKYLKLVQEKYAGTTAAKLAKQYKPK